MDAEKFEMDRQLIVISKETKTKLSALKKTQSETYDEVLKRVV